MHGVARLARLLSLSYAIHIVSGRDSSAREQTLKNLVRDTIPCDVLSLSEGDTELSDDHLTWKTKHAKAVIVAGGSIILAVDDRVEMIAAYAELGIPCLVVNDCYEIPHPDPRVTATSVGRSPSA